MTSNESDPRYRVVFEGKGCIGSGKCAEVSSNWEMDLERGIAQPVNHFFDEDDLEHNKEAAEACPARKGRGVIEIVDTQTGEVVAPSDRD